MKLPGRDWQIHVADADVDAAPELITVLATTYAQLAADDTIELISADNADKSQTATVITIDDEGNRVANEIALDGTTLVTLPGGTHRHYEGFSLDKECAGVITIRRNTSTTFIDSIAVGKIRDGVAQHFNGQFVTRLKSWSASNVAGTDDVKLELRWYPDDADCRDAGDGFEIIDTIVTKNAQEDTVFHPMNEKKQYPGGGWFAVYGIGGTADEHVAVTVIGRDDHA